MFNFQWSPLVCCAAGGFIKGKATCENLCVSGSSFSSASGPVLNPYDTTRAAGGSSSGSAVLVMISLITRRLINIFIILDVNVKND